MRQFDRAICVTDDYGRPISGTSVTLLGAGWRITVDWRHNFGADPQVWLAWDKQVAEEVSTWAKSQGADQVEITEVASEEELVGRERGRFNTSVSLSPETSVDQAADYVRWYEADLGLASGSIKWNFDPGDGKAKAGILRMRYFTSSV